MATIIETDAVDHACPFNNFAPCLGAGCMAWRWDGPSHERCETDNLIETAEGPRPSGVPATPEGDGWLMDGSSFPKGYHRSEKDKLPRGAGQRWVRPIPRSSGFCARVGGDGSYW